MPDVGERTTSPRDLSDQDLLSEVVKAGAHLLQSGKLRLADLGNVQDDDRWGDCPLPLRFDLQVATLFLGALDAYDVAAGILLGRASQQAFNVLRFQLESLALIRWMSEPLDVATRRHHAYRVACGQLRRFGKFLLEDASHYREALKGVHHVRRWGTRLREIAAEDGIPHLKGPPDRKELLGKHGKTSGYPTFSMFSELGSHPGAAGNTLFSIRPGASKISFDLEGATVARAFFASSAILYLWQTCQAASKALDWSDWLATQAKPAYGSALPLMAESLRRRRETAEAAPLDSPSDSPGSE